MATKEARTRATQRWRQRTQQKLVQVYLHTDIVAKLDRLVTEAKASGRAAVVARLVQDAAKCLHTDTPDTQQSGDPWLDLDDTPEIPRTDERCMVSTTRGARCKSKGVAWRRVEIDGHRWLALVCKVHQDAISIDVHRSKIEIVIART